MSTLVLGIPEGQDFYVGDTRIIVTKVYDAHSFKVKVMHPRPLETVVSDKRATQIAPQVTLSCGKRSGDDIARVVIQAPREINIKRGNVLRRELASHY